MLLIMGTRGLWRSGQEGPAESVVGPGLGVHNLRGLAEIASDVLIAREETVLMAEVSGVGAPGPLGPFVAGFAGELSRQGYKPQPVGKQCVTPPRCRLLHAGVDTTVIALWLGHEQVETRQLYLHADLALKERGIGPGRSRSIANPAATDRQMSPRISGRALTAWSAPSAVGRMLPLGEGELDPAAESSMTRRGLASLDG